MSWKGDLITRLRADGGLAALCGTRIAWDERARSSEGTLPAIVLQIVFPGREYTHSGPDGLDGPRVQFEIFGHGGDQLEAVKAALLPVMEAGGTSGSTKFHPAFLEGELGWEPEDSADGKRLHRLTLDFEFFWESV